MFSILNLKTLILKAEPSKTLEETMFASQQRMLARKTNKKYFFTVTVIFRLLTLDYANGRFWVKEAN